MNLRLYRIAGIFLLVAALHLFLYSRLPDARRDYGWATIVMTPLFDFYRTQISRRAPGNRKVAL